MPSQIVVPDTIYDNPAFNDLNPASQTVLGGRLMSSAPHTDGLLFAGAGQCDRDSANLLLTRNGNGDWTLNRTAAGAETYHIRAILGDMGGMLRIGEQYVLGDFPATGFQTYAPNAPAKGLEIKDFFAVYKSGVVALTSATLRFGKMVYSSVAGGAAPVQTDIVAATAISTANTANYQEQDILGPSPLVFSVDDLAIVEVEATIVMANTGTLAFVGIGCHVNFNYT